MPRLRKAQPPPNPWKGRQEMRAYLGKLERRGAKSVGTPTPERALKAGEGNMPQRADGVIRIEDCQLDKLAARCKLAPKDHKLNAILKAAGEQYYRDWYKGNLSPSPAAPMSERIDAVSVLILPDGHGPDFHANRWRKAGAAIVAMLRVSGTRIRQVVDAVVLEDQTVALVGQYVTGLSDVHSATSVTLERLRLGLERLASHYGFIDHHR